MKKSKKPSATSAAPPELATDEATIKDETQKPDAAPRPVLFLDRAIQGRALSDALRKAGANVELHRDHFQHDAEDTVWLPEVGRRSWFVLTRDERIRYNPLEQEAVRRAKVGMFVFIPKNLPGSEIATIIVAALPSIERIASKTSRPFIAKIFRDSSVERWI